MIPSTAQVSFWANQSDFFFAVTWHVSDTKDNREMVETTGQIIVERNRRE